MPRHSPWIWTRSGSGPDQEINVPEREHLKGVGRMKVRRERGGA